MKFQGAIVFNSRDRFVFKYDRVAYRKWIIIKVTVAEDLTQRLLILDVEHMRDPACEDYWHYFGSILPNVMMSHAVAWRRACKAGSVTSNRIGSIYWLGSFAGSFAMV